MTLTFAIEYLGYR